MKLPRMRFAVWQMMVAVALVACVLWIERSARRRAEYAKWADYHEGMLDTLALIRREGYYPYCGLYLPAIPERYDAETAPFHAKCVAYHSSMMKKYRNAARLPWFAVAPDPPPPYPVPSYFDYGSGSE
jgi:hypothetical protein